LTPTRANQRPERLIGFLDLTPEGDCFNQDNVISSNLNEVRWLFGGVLKEIADPNAAANGSKVERTPLVMTTSRGNAFSISNSYELMFLDGPSLMRQFADGTKPATMGYLVTGRLKSSFPDGIKVESKSKDPNDPNETVTTTKQVTGLKEAAEDCAVVVFSDVDFISNALAYQNSFFGPMVVGDNSTLLLNAIDDLSGSSDLVSIRSRGNFKRPFVVVDEIEHKAEAETAKEVDKINAQIAGFQNELQSIASSAKQGQEEVIGGSIMQKRQDLELKIREAQRQLRQVKMIRREQIEKLGNRLRQANMLGAPAVILIIAIVLSIRRGAKKRHYISHTSDA
jgi:ABC-2 type transport system permease protein